MSCRFKGDREKGAVGIGGNYSVSVPVVLPEASQAEGMAGAKHRVLKRKMRLKNTDQCDVTVLVRVSFQPQGKEAKGVYIWSWIE